VIEKMKMDKKTIISWIQREGYDLLVTKYRQGFSRSREEIDQREEELRYLRSKIRSWLSDLEWFVDLTTCSDRQLRTKKRRCTEIEQCGLLVLRNRRLKLGYAVRQQSIYNIETKALDYLIKKSGVLERIGCDKRHNNIQVWRVPKSYTRFIDSYFGGLKKPLYKKEKITLEDYRERLAETNTVILD